MKTLLRCLLLLGLGAMLAPVAWAENKLGVGLMLGVADTGIDCTGCFPVDVTGPSLGADFQFPLGEYVSINPFYLSTSESGTLSRGIGEENVDLDSTALGVQVRAWLGDFFLGAHVARYEFDVKVTSVQATDSVSLDEVGNGIALGYENPNGFFVTLRTDEASPADDAFSPPVDYEFESLRLYVGFRFWGG